MGFNHCGLDILGTGLRPPIHLTQTIGQLSYSSNFCLLPTWSAFELAEKGSVSHYQSPEPSSHPKFINFKLTLGGWWSFVLEPKIQMNSKFKSRKMIYHLQNSEENKWKWIIVSALLIQNNFQQSLNFMGLHCCLYRNYASCVEFS